MNFEDQNQFLAKFVERWGDAELYSTGADLVNFSGPLYNVDGSSPDPKLNGESWKGLLLDRGINTPCYVANETPDGNSHPRFSVGGHMTPNPDGQVATGADSYLMPLCSWHNSKARDGVPFTLNRTWMLKLSGFLQSEIAATFMAAYLAKSGTPSSIRVAMTSYVPIYLSQKQMLQSKGDFPTTC